MAREPHLDPDVLAMTGKTPPARVRAKLWDGPTRIVHWLIVVLLAVSWVTAETGVMSLHRWSGYFVLGLVVFRLYWGFAGSQSARFASFIKGPRTTLAYVRSIAGRTSSEVAGHNPLGAWSVLALLALLAAQVGFGLFAVDVDGLESGPFSYLVEFDVGRTAARLHHLTFVALQMLVALHLAALAFYFIHKRQNLIGAMITGRRHFEADPQLTFAPAWRAVAGLVAAAMLVWLVSHGFRF